MTAPSSLHVERRFTPAGGAASRDTDHMRLVPVCHAHVLGGAERYLNLLYPRLRERGHQGHLVGSVPGWTEVTGLPSTAVAFSPKWGGRATARRLPHLPRERRAVAAAIRDLRADLFHAQFKREQVGLTDLLARQAPVIWTEHGRFPTGTGARALAAGYRQAARKVGAIICVSRAVADELRGIVGPRVRIEVV